MKVKSPNAQGTVYSEANQLGQSNNRFFQSFQNLLPKEGTESHYIFSRVGKSLCCLAGTIACLAVAYFICLGIGSSVFGKNGPVFLWIVSPLAGLVTVILGAICTIAMGFLCYWGYTTISDDRKRYFEQYSSV